MDSLPEKVQDALCFDGHSSCIRERRFSDADRSSALRPGLVTMSQMSRRSPTTEVAPLTTTNSEPLQQHECRAPVCALSRTVGTTELLEMILDHLDTTNVLAFRLISRKWSETIRDSPGLRLHMFVHPQWNRHPRDFQLIDMKMQGLSVEPGDEVHMGRWIQVRMNAAAARAICPEARPFRRRSRSIFEGMRGGLGSRGERSIDPWPALEPYEINATSSESYQELHVMQPPIVGMQAFIIGPSPVNLPSEPNHDSKDDDELCASAKLHCDAGIKLSFLAETALSLLAGAPPAGQQDNRSVLFKAIVSFTAPTRAPGQRSKVRSVTRIG